MGGDAFLKTSLFLHDANAIMLSPDLTGRSADVTVPSSILRMLASTDVAWSKLHAAVAFLGS